MAPAETKQVLRTIFIGLGGTGKEVISEVKYNMLSHDYDLPVYRYLVLDTAPYNQELGKDPRTHLHPGEEYLHIGGYSPNEILKNITDWPEITSWWEKRAGKGVSLTVDDGAAQLRSIGRMSFFRHFTNIQQRLERIVREVMEGSDRGTALMRNYRILPDRPPIIYLVFSLCGGTGSSLFFDVAYVLRQMFAVKVTIIGVAMLPGPVCAR